MYLPETCITVWNHIIVHYLIMPEQEWKVAQKRNSTVFMLANRVIFPWLFLVFEQV